MHSTIGLAILLALLSLPAQAQNQPPGYVEFGKFTPPSSGGQFVQIDLKSNLVAMASQMAKTGAPEVADLLQNLHSVRVNVIGVTDENREEIQNRLKTVRADLDGKGWQPIVTVQEKGEDVGIYIKTRGQEAVEGLVVTVLERKGEAVFINVVGDLKPDQLGALGETFKIGALKKISHKLKKP